MNTFAMYFGYVSLTYYALCVVVGFIVGIVRGLTK